MAHETAAHPKKDDLMAFGLGKLPPEDASRIETHLEACPGCCDTMLELQDDTFVALVKRSPPPVSDDTDADGSQPESSAHTAFQPTVLGSDDGTPPVPLSGEETDLPAELRQHARYRILERIGQGGMGDVYKAEHRVMNRPVALKVIKPELVQNESAIQRFHREVQAAARLQHGNIVTAHDAERAGNSHFLVMEFVDGINLDEVIRAQGPLAVEKACDSIRQTALGLEHARELGLVHRDIKPHNLMRTESGDVKILDFGLASFASHAATEEGDSDEGTRRTQLPTVEVLHQLTQMGAMMGTPDYIAPEQAKDARQADIRADIYSLGCTFHTLLTGKPPFQGDSVAEKLSAHAGIDPEPLSSFRDDVPAGVEAVLKKMMAKAPDERYQTPAEVAEALEPHCQISAAPAKPRSRWWTLTAVAVGLLAVIAFAVYYIQTDYGVVRIEVADPSLAVKINGQTIAMKDGEKTLTIRPGEKTLTVERDGFLFETDNFQLRRGENLALKVELLDGEVLVQKDGELFGAKALHIGDTDDPVLMTYKDDQTWYLDGSLMTPKEVGERLRAILKKDPNREVVIETPRQFGFYFIKQMDSIIRNSGGKRVRWPDWSHPELREEEWKQLAGLWQAISVEQGGIAEKPEQVKEIEILVEERKITFLHQGKPDRGIIDIQPAASLKEIDLYAPSKDRRSARHRLGIYELTPNRSGTGVENWRICLAAPGQPRPQVFSTKPGGGGGDQMFVLRRQEASNNPPAASPSFRKRLDSLAASVREGMDYGRLMYWLKHESPSLVPLEPPFPRTVLELLGGLSAEDLDRLLKDGYLKWDYSRLDPNRQAAFKEVFRFFLSQIPQTKTQEEFSEAGIESALEDKNYKVGFAVVEIPNSTDPMISWCILPRVGSAKPFGFPIFGVTKAVIKSGKMMDIQLARLRELQSKPNSPLPANEVVVTFTKNDGKGMIRFGGQTVTTEELHRQLKELVRQDPDLQVRVAGDVEIGDSDSAPVFTAITMSGVKLDNIKLDREIVEETGSAIGQARKEARRKQKLKQIGVALNNFADSYKHFPPNPHAQNAYDAQGRPFLSWRVHLLPYIEQEDLYKKFRFNEPWDSEHNIKLLDRMPEIYKTTDDPTQTTLLAVVGKGTAYEGTVGIDRDNAALWTDGRSNTAYVVDAGQGKAVPWTKPEDLPLDEADPVRAFGKPIFDDKFLALLADGSVKSIAYDTAPEQLRNLFLRADGNVVDLTKKRKTPLPSPVDDEVSLVREYKGHTNIVKSVDFSPDGQLIASASGFPRGDNSVRIWDRESGKELHRLDDHFIPVVFVTFSPDGKRLLSGDIQGRIILWSLNEKLGAWNQKKIDWSNDKIMIDQAVFTPDGKRIVYLKVNPHAASEALNKVTNLPEEQQDLNALRDITARMESLIKHTIEVVDAANGKSVKHIPLDKNAMPGLAVTPDNRHVAVPMYDGTLRLISLETGKEIHRYPAPQIDAAQGFALVAAVSPDGNKLAAGYRDHAVRVWDLQTGKVLKDLRTANPSNNLLAFFSDNRRLAACGPVVQADPDSPAACVLDTETGEVLAETPAILGDGFAFALAPNERQILTAGGTYWDAKRLKWEDTHDYDLHLWQLPKSVWPEEPQPTERIPRLMPQED